jgi:hypothetical protein
LNDSGVLSGPVQGRHTSLDRAQLLDSPECDRVASDVMALREHWSKPYASLAPFFALGAASYIDQTKSSDYYRDRAAMLNPILRERFGWLLDRVSEAVSTSLELQSTWLEGSALPGVSYLSCERPLRHAGRTESLRPAIYQS